MLRPPRLCRSRPASPLSIRNPSCSTTTPRPLGRRGLAGGGAASRRTRGSARDGAHQASPHAAQYRASGHRVQARIRHLEPTRRSGRRMPAIVPILSPQRKPESMIRAALGRGRAAVPGTLDLHVVVDAPQCQRVGSGERRPPNARRPCSATALARLRNTLPPTTNTISRHNTTRAI